MRILLLIVAVVTLASFKERECCEYLSEEGSTSYITIFPICGDSSLYIVRWFDREKYIHENIYKDRKVYSQTHLDFDFYDKVQRRPKNIDVEETFNQDGKKIEMRSSSQFNYTITGKTFFIDTDLAFVINYYPDGFIRDYRLVNGENSLSNGAELSPMNTYMWRGRFGGPWLRDTAQVMDTVANKMKTQDIFYYGKRTGTWTKTDFTGKVLKTIKYSD